MNNYGSINRKEIILAGVARSGSTLVCYLLNKTSNAVALLEPIQPKELNALSQDKVVSFLQGFFEAQRTSLIERKLAKSKSTNQKVPDNLMGGINSKSGKREIILDGDSISIKRNLGSDFSLIVKQPGMFTGMLYFLKYHFPCYATIRNPLAILQSWNSVELPVKDGHAPAAEQCDPKLKLSLVNEKDVYMRQLILLSWYFEQFYNHLPAANIIRYEEVVDTGGKCLSCMVASASQLREDLKSKNKNTLYNESLKLELANRLLASDGFYWNYYTTDDIHSLL